MARFFYKAKNKNGDVVANSINASNISDAAIKLEKEGLVVLEIKEELSNAQIKSSNYSKNISKETMFTLKEKIEFFNSFYYMFKSGLSVYQIFESVMNASNNKKIKGLCSVVIKKIEKGYSLEEAFSGYGNVLGAVYCKLIVAGESSGKLEQVLSKTIDNLKREENFKSKMISALTYPTMILSLAVAVFFFFKFFILKVFASFGNGICPATIMTWFIFAVVKIVLIFAFIAGVICYIYFNKKVLRKVIDIVVKIPMVQSIMRAYSFANFFSVLSLAYDSGVPLPQSVELASDVISVKSMKTKISLAVKRIYNGCELTTAFGVSQLFSSFAMSQVSAGEKAGELEKMFAVVSLDYEKQIDLAINVLSEAVKIVSMLFVGLIVLYVAVTGYKSYYAGLFGAFGL
ncbi:MAG: type II secretion system F family protein [Cyanobacteria bacterium SIG29]|nr:type II secretion system F family protein [Cyanobacteria bacterium SIG29]